jgi:hypothetical protein
MSNEKFFGSGFDAPFLNWPKEHNEDGTHKPQVGKTGSDGFELVDFNHIVTPVGAGLVAANVGIRRAYMSSSAVAGKRSVAYFDPMGRRETDFNKKIIIEFIVSILARSLNGGHSVRVQELFLSDLVLPSEGFGFYFWNDLGTYKIAGIWRAELAIAPSLTNNRIAYNLGDWYILRAELNIETGVLAFYVNNVLLEEVTVNLPGGALIGLGSIMFVAGNNADAQANAMHVAKVSFAYNL